MCAFEKSSPPKPTFGNSREPPRAGWAKGPAARSSDDSMVSHTRWARLGSSDKDKMRLAQARPSASLRRLNSALASRLTGVLAGGLGLALLVLAAPAARSAAGHRQTQEAPSQTLDVVRGTHRILELEAPWSASPSATPRCCRWSRSTPASCSWWA